MSEINSRILFNERTEDINEYFEFIDMLINKKPTLVYQEQEQNINITRTTKVTKDLTHVLKSNAFLILYNLIEATISNAIEDIHDEILRDTNLGADLLCVNLTKIALRKIEISNLSNFDCEKTNASQIILKSWLKKHKELVENHKNPLFSGNVDARKIREIAEDYGFSSETEQSKTFNGACLVAIKKSRNSLAHGSDSFKQKGRDTSIDDLIAFKEQTICYLDNILTNIETYLQSKQYLRPISTSTSLII